MDTSVWVDHLRRSNPRLESLLHHGEVAVHPFVIGELSLGTLSNRREVLELLEELTSAELADHDLVLEFVERYGLAGSGIGWVDAHLLVSAALGRASVWTLDRRLSVAARSLGLSAS